MTTTRTQWEYKTVELPGGGLNAWGREGWELVTVTDPTDGSALAFFKRPKQAEHVAEQELISE